MHRAILALTGILAAAPLMTSPAAAQSVKLQYGMPLGTFTAHPSGRNSAAPSATSHGTSKHAATQPVRPRSKRNVAAAPVEIQAPREAQPSAATVRDDAAAATAVPQASASNEPQKAETNTEANAPTTVASGEKTTCRKFIATAGTTIEVPCTAASQ